MRASAKTGSAGPRKGPKASPPGRARPISPRGFARRALALLKEHADQQTAHGVQKYFKREVKTFGVRAPVLRRIESDLYQQTLRAWTEEEALELCSLLLPDRRLEAKALPLLTLRRFAKRLGPAFLDTAEDWLSRNYCDNWATTDALCPSTVGTVIENHPQTIRRVLRWTRSPNRWVRRASAVSFVNIARRGRHLEAAYDVARRLFSDREDDLVQKGNGWMLREAGRTDPGRLERFLLDHGPAVPRTTLRYAVEHFPERKRKALLARTKSDVRHTRPGRAKS